MTVKTAGTIAALIGTGWNMIYKLAIVGLAIFGLVIWVQSCAGGSLTEQSSCSDYEQASYDQQTQVLQQMMQAHNDQEDIGTARLSVAAYCNIMGPNAPIDGVYNG